MRCGIGNIKTKKVFGTSPKFCRSVIGLFVSCIMQVVVNIWTLVELLSISGKAKIGIKIKNPSFYIYQAYQQLWNENNERCFIHFAKQDKKRKFKLLIMLLLDGESEIFNQRDESTRVWIVHEGCKCSPRVEMFSMRRASLCPGAQPAKPVADGGNNRRLWKRNEMFLMNENAARDHWMRARAVCVLCAMKSAAFARTLRVETFSGSFLSVKEQLIKCTCWNESLQIVEDPLCDSIVMTSRCISEFLSNCE